MVFVVDNFAMNSILANGAGMNNASCEQGRKYNITHDPISHSFYVIGCVECGSDFKDHVMFQIYTCL